MKHTNKLASDSLNKTENDKLSLLDDLKIGVQENDCSGVITYSNRAHHLILGYEAGELIGKNIWDFQPSPGEKEALKTYFFKLLKEQPAPKPYITRNKRSDGKLVDLEIDWDYKFDDNGKLNGFISVITDMRNQKKIEKHVNKRTKTLSTLLEVSKNLVSTLDIQQVLQATVDGITRLIGLDTAAIYLLEDEKLILWATTPPLPPQFPDDLRIARLKDHPHIQKVILSGDILVVPDYRKVELTPEEKSVSEQRNLSTLLFAPLIADEKVMGAFIVGSVGEPIKLPDSSIELSQTLANLAALAIRNAQLFKDGQSYAKQLEVTLAERIRAEEEAKKLQAQLLQAQKMESIGTLAGGVAHDFNNLLTVINGFAELSQAKLDKTEQLYFNIEEIKKASKRAENLIKQLLAFSRKQIFKSEILDINSVIISMDKMLHRLIGEDIKIVRKFAENLPPINADNSQLEQIFINLVVNARDAVNDQIKKDYQKKITIETGLTELDNEYVSRHEGSTIGPHIFFSVSDNGIGMDETTRKRIFEPFFTTKEMYRGTGLGLSTVYGIVKQNLGSAYVYSEPGTGTTLRILWPVTSRKSEKKSRKTAPVQIISGTETVLLVEDDPAVCKFAAEALTLLGYKLHSVPNGKIALEKIKKEKIQFDIIITDLIMPELNGKDFIRKVNSIYKNVKVIYISGYTDNHIVHNGLLEENINFIQKPFSVKTLAEKVRQVLDNN